MSSSFDFHTMMQNLPNKQPTPETATVQVLCESAGKMLKMRDVKPYCPESVLTETTSRNRMFGSSQSERPGMSKYRLVCVKSVLDNDEPEPMHAPNTISGVSESSGEWEDVTDDEEPLIPTEEPEGVNLESSTDISSEIATSEINDIKQYEYEKVANLHELSSSPEVSPNLGEDEDELEAFLNQDECMSDSLSLHEETFVSHNVSKAEVDKFVKSIRSVTVDDDIAGCFSIQGMVEKRFGGEDKSGWRTVKLNNGTSSKQYEQTLFCKMSPLIEPLKVVDDTLYPDYMELSEYKLPGTTARQVVEKINSINNSSHVEALAMYMNSRLTEQGRCPTFPYFYGCLNGISKTYYHDITDEISMYAEQQWFVDKARAGKIDLCTVNLSELGDEIKTNPKYSIPPASPTNNMLSRCVDADSSNLQSRLLGINRLSELGAGLDDELSELEIDGPVDTSTPESSIVTERTGATTSDILLNAHILDADADIDTLDLAGLESSDVYDNKIFYMKMTDYPVSYCFMEKMGTTLDALMHGPKPLGETEWLSVLFQVAFGLAVAWKSHHFVHNDLHCANIMFQSTAENYLYFFINGHYYRVPTFHRVAKIIDFARATFQVNGSWIFSDVFLHGGDAAEQYTYPDEHGKIKKSADTVLPNPSFDLVLLSTSIFNDIDDKHVALKSMIYNWCQSNVKFADNMLERPVEFQLYIDISRECKNAKPKNVLKDALFQRFRIKKSKIPAGKFVYVY